MKPAILILDAELRSTLSLLRSLSTTRKYKLLVGGHSRFALARYSIHSDGFIRYANPAENREQFLQSLESILALHQIDYILPASDITLFAIYSSPSPVPWLHKLIAPDQNAYLLSFDKRKMNQIALSCGVKVIEEVPFHPEKRESLSFPLVLKPRQSLFSEHEQLIRGFRHIIYLPDDFQKSWKEISAFDPEPLVQKKLEGKGYGVFAGVKEGHIFASFAHERVREVPLEGGVSSMSRSIPVHPRLFSSAEKLLKKLNWTGIVMVEFKGEHEQDACFLEINGRPWGSIDLAVQAGVPFPKMLTDLFVEKLSLNELRETYNRPYRLNHFSRWVPGEIRHAWQVMMSRQPFFSKWRSLLRLFVIPASCSYDTFQIKDPLPFFMELVYWMMKK